MSHTPALSVVIPCHNEERSLERLERELTAALSPAGLDWEAIVVDDGSTDATAETAARIALENPRFGLVELSRNFGKEAAMLAGLREARGECVAIMDGDLQHPPGLIPGMHERLRRDESVDQVIARRNRTGDGAVRTVLSRLYYRLINALVDDVRFTDGAGDFRVMRRPMVEALLACPERNRFSKGLFEWVGFRAAVIEYENVQRQEGASAWSLRSLFNYGLSGVLAFNPKPLRVVAYLGFMATVLGLAHLAYSGVTWLVQGVEVPGYLTLIGLLTLFSGVQLVTMGVIGEYLGATYTETKSRPHYLVRRRVGRPEGPQEAEPAFRPEIPRQRIDRDSGMEAA